MRHFFLKLTVLLGVALCFLPGQVQAQICRGTVVDSLTGENLFFVHVGVQGRNVGVLSDDRGQFELDLSEVDDGENVSFSIIGYKTAQLTKSAALEKNIVVKLQPISYELAGVVVRAKALNEIKLGRLETTKVTTGQSGIKKFGFGGEWGIKITYPGEPYYLKDIRFHTRFNTVDSVLYRMNVYEVVDGLPGESKLLEEVFTTSYRKNKWISASVLAQNLIVDEDIIVTFELVQIWYGSKGENQLFYTHGKGYEEGQSFSKGSSFDSWKVNERPPLAMYVTGIEVE